MLTAVGSLTDKVNTMEKKLKGSEKLTTGRVVPYCFMHGADKKHNGMECRGMKSGYTMAQKCATGPGIVDGKTGRT